MYYVYVPHTMWLCSYTIKRTRRSIRTKKQLSVLFEQGTGLLPVWKAVGSSLSCGCRFIIIISLPNGKWLGNLEPNFGYQMVTESCSSLQSSESTELRCGIDWQWLPIVGTHWASTRFSVPGLQYQVSSTITSSSVPTLQLEITG